MRVAALPGTRLARASESDSAWAWKLRLMMDLGRVSHTATFKVEKGILIREKSERRLVFEELR